MAKNRPEFHPAKRLQRSYERGIKEITGQVIVAKRPDQTFDQWLDAIAKRSIEPDVQAASELLARRMVAQVNVGNRRTWREAARLSSRSKVLHEALEAEMEGPTGARVSQLIRENAKLISSLPLEAATRLNGEVAEAARNGARPATIAKMAGRRFPELLRSRTNLISRTETAKASTALTEARCERLNISFYQWLDVGDVRTRRSHKAMHEVIVPWAHAPSPEALVGEKSTLGAYHAGECPNCRCLVLPILSLDDIAFPARVYWNGTVTTMTKPAFKKVAIGVE
jgi:SPP1 gp7 family putative phage head morphogenesis protein